MKAVDVRAMSADQLNDELAKLKKEQFNLRFQKATGQLEKTARVKQVRKDIARIDALWQQGLDTFGGPFLAGTNFTPGGSFRRLVVSETVSMRNSVFLVRSGF